MVRQIVHGLEILSSHSRLQLTVVTVPSSTPGMNPSIRFRAPLTSRVDEGCTE